MTAESSLDFDAYWKAWLASRLAEIREKAERARQLQQQAEGGHEEEEEQEQEFQQPLGTRLADHFH